MPAVGCGCMHLGHRPGSSKPGWLWGMWGSRAADPIPISPRWSPGLRVAVLAGLCARWDAPRGAERGKGTSVSARLVSGWVHAQHMSLQARWSLRARLRRTWAGAGGAGALRKGPQMSLPPRAAAWARGARRGLAVAGVQPARAPAPWCGRFACFRLLVLFFSFLITFG